MNLKLLVLCVLVLACVASAAQQRILLVRDIPAGTKKCLNTAQGWRYLTDDKGYVCTRDQMDYGSGCCKTGQRHSCDKCKLTDKCCSEYEYCVSCCLAPQHDADKLHARTLRSPKNPAAGTWPSAWEYCRGVCRTHSASTSHENAYINVRHHCFSELGRPMLSEPLPSGALAGVTVVMGAGGESCDDVCSKRGQMCSAPHLSVLNSCDRLREQVGCEAGCEASKLPGGSCPAYVESTAPKQARPAMCFVQPAVEVASLACGAKEASTRRLCPCKAARRY